MVKFVMDKPKSTEGKTYLYRYVDGWHTEAILNEYEIVKETPKGYWIKRWPWSDSNDLKWVGKEGKNNFAKVTKERAMENYYHRKRRQVIMLESQLRKAKALLRYARIETEREATTPMELSL